MKITLKQKREIIKRAAKRIKDGSGLGLCWAIKYAISDILNIDIHPVFIERLQTFLPEFKNSTAVKYFGGIKDGTFWWEVNANGKKRRLQFLNYLLTGKLPKVKK